MGRDGPVHRVPDCRIAAALDATRKRATEVSLTLDVVHLACIAVYDEVASGEGAVLYALISDMERDLVIVECAGESAVAVECCEADRLAFVRCCMHHVPLDSQCCACDAACESESLMHCDNRCVVAQSRWTRTIRALRERE